MTPFDELTPEGRSRGEPILADALREADRRRRRRAVRHVGVVGCACALIAGVAIVARRAERGDQVVPSAVATTAPAPRLVPRLIVHRTPAPKLVVVEVIRADDVKPAWETVSDEQLLGTLAEAGKPSGIVNVNGTARLVPIPRRNPS
jgi:hypothetical protein